MVYARSGATATPRADGSLMVVGGQGINGSPLTTVERFDPVTLTWAVMPGSLTTSSLDQSVILLKDGRVFVTSWPDFVVGHWSTADVQILDPTVAGSSPMPTPASSVTGTWSGMPDIAAPFGNYSAYGGGFSSTATATPLTDGRVLVIGTAPAAALHCSLSCVGETSVAIYDPAKGQSSVAAVPSTVNSSGFTTTLVSNGKVLVVGGGTELYDPSTGQWSTAAPLTVKRIGHTATLLSDGRVLVAGGLAGPQANGGYDRLTSVEIYDSKANKWSLATDLPTTLGDAGNTATLLQDGRVLVVGGYNPSAALYDTKSNRWSAAASLSEPAQVPHTATLLSDGRVLVLGGCASRPSFGCERLAPPQIFDPRTGGWSLAAPMQHGREAFSATLLRNGLVLVAGGYGSESVVASAELYDPVANSWTGTGDMTIARAGPIATRLGNGGVLIIGGSFLGNLSSAELFTPPKAVQKSGLPESNSGSQPSRLVVPLLATVAVLALIAIVLLTVRLRIIKRR